MDTHNVPTDQPTETDAPRVARTRVTAAELKALWFRDDADTLIHDHQTNEKVVRLTDGREYACPLDDPDATA